MRSWRVAIGVLTAILGLSLLFAPFGTAAPTPPGTNRCSPPLAQVAAEPRPAPEPDKGRNAQPICREVGTTRAILAGVLILVATADLFGQSARARQHARRSRYRDSPTPGWKGNRWRPSPRGRHRAGAG